MTDAAIAAVTSLIWSDRHVSINVQINLDIYDIENVDVSHLNRFHC